MTETITGTDAPDSAGDPQETNPDLGDAGKKAIDAERRRRAAAEKEAKALKAQLDEINAAKLSDIEKAQKAAADANARLAEYEKTLMRQRIGLEKGLKPQQVARLVGETEEELAADADAYLAELSAPSTPKPDPSQGAKPGIPALNDDGLLSALKSAVGAR